MPLAWLILGYFAGSAPTGYIVAKVLMGIDIRTIGSGNIGATNVGRLMGKEWAMAVAIFDMLKGGIIVFAASFFITDPTVLALTGAVSVIGHDYPVWLRFRGGKGVATTFGVFAFYDFFDPWPALLGGAVWYLVLKKTKYVSVSSMVGLASAAIFMIVFGMPWQYCFAGFTLTGMSVWRHRPNIKNLKNGVEKRVK